MRLFPNRRGFMATAAASLTLGIIHLVVWFNQRSHHANLTFFALALSVAVFSGFELAIVGAQRTRIGDATTPIGHRRSAPIECQHRADRALVLEDGQRVGIGLNRRGTCQRYLSSQGVVAGSAVDRSISTGSESPAVDRDRFGHAREAARDHERRPRRNRS